MYLKYSYIFKRIFFIFFPHYYIPLYTLGMVLNYQYYFQDYFNLFEL